MIRCGVYLRQSEDADGDELAVSRQWDEIIAQICTPRGWEPVRYCDNDRTAVGAKRKLPERDRLLADIESGELQAMAAWDCDRLYREPIDLEHIIAVADKHHTLLATVTGDIDLGTDNGRLFARIKGAVAKSETERRSARQKAKYRQLAESGDNLGWRRSFGRHPDGSLHPIEAPMLASAFYAFLAGHTVGSIRADWNAQGVTTTQGFKWNEDSQLRTVMRNPRCAGLKSYRGEVIGEGGFEPIVPSDVWRAAMEIFDDPGRRPADLSRKYLLSGLMQCGLDCEPGATVRASRSSPTSVNAYPIYQCRKCWRARVSMASADDLVITLMDTRLRRPDALDLLIDQQHPDLDAKRAEASALRARLRSLAVDFADGEIDSDQMKFATKRIRDKLKAVDGAIEDANRAHLFKGVVGPDAPAFGDLHLDRQRAIIGTLMAVTLYARSLRGVFDPDSVVVSWLPVA